MKFENKSKNNKMDNLDVSYENLKQTCDESGIEEVLGNVDDKYIEKMEIIKWRVVYKYNK